MVISRVNKIIEYYVNSGSQALFDENNVHEMGRRIKFIIDEYNQNRTISTISLSKDIDTLIKVGLDWINTVDSRDANVIAKNRIIGLIIFDSTIEINDEISVDRRKTIAEHIRKILEVDRYTLENYAFTVRIAVSVIGHIARVATATAELEYLSNDYLPFTNRLLLNMKSDIQRYAGVLILFQLAANIPHLMFAKRKYLTQQIIWDLVSDKSSMVREAASNTLESILVLISQRESIVDNIKTALTHVHTGFVSNSSEKILGSLIILNIITNGFVISATDLQSNQKLMKTCNEVIILTFQRKESKDSEVRKKVIDIIPRLAAVFTSSFLQPTPDMLDQNYLNFSIKFLLNSTKSTNDRNQAYLSLGKLFVVMASHLRMSTLLNELFSAINTGFKDPFCSDALTCLGLVLNSSLAARKFVTVEIVDAMFRGGLNQIFIDSLRIVVKQVPRLQSHIQSQLRNFIANILNQYLVLIDDSVGKSRLLTSHAKRGILSTATSSITATASSAVSNVFGSPSRMARPSSLWGTSANTSSQDINSANLNTANGNNTQNKQAEAEIILALHTLSSTDFFPKQIRERILNSSENEKKMIAKDEKYKKRQSIESIKMTSGWSDPVGSSQANNSANSNQTAVVYEDQSYKLLLVLKDCVVRYYDDCNFEIRRTALLTTATVIDNIILSNELDHLAFKEINHMINRILMIGVGDDAPEIRYRVFSSLPSSLDYMISQSDCINCLIEALNDEFIEVRSAAMAVFCRLAHFDSLRFMPLIRLYLTSLLRHLHSKDAEALRPQSVLLIQAMVKGCNVHLLAPYVAYILEPLVSLINDPSPTVVGAALTTIAELGFSSPHCVSQYLDDLLSRLILALNDTSPSNIQRDVAVQAIGKLVPALTMITEEPYKKYPGLFQGLYNAIQNEDESSVLRHEAIRTAGLLGIVDSNVYERHLRRLRELETDFYAQTEELDVDSNDLEGDDMGPKKYFVMLPIVSTSDSNNSQKSMNLFHFNLVIQLLLKILKDSSLSSHHEVTSVNIVKIVSIVGQDTSPYILQIINAFISRIYEIESSSVNNLVSKNDTNNLISKTSVVSVRNSVNLIDHLIIMISSLIEAFGYDPTLKRLYGTLIKLIHDFIFQNLSKCVKLIEVMYQVFPTSEFTIIIESVLPILLQNIQKEVGVGFQVQDYSLNSGSGKWSNGIGLNSNSSKLGFVVSKTANEGLNGTIADSNSKIPFDDEDYSLIPSSNGLGSANSSFKQSGSIKYSVNSGSNSAFPTDFINNNTSSRSGNNNAFRFTTPVSGFMGLASGSGLGHGSSHNSSLNLSSYQPLSSPNNYSVDSSVVGSGNFNLQGSSKVAKKIETPFTEKMCALFTRISNCLKEYRQQLFPILINVLLSLHVPTEIRRLSLSTLIHLVITLNDSNHDLSSDEGLPDTLESHYCNLVIHPLIRMLGYYQNVSHLQLISLLANQYTSISTQSNQVVLSNPLVNDISFIGNIFSALSCFVCYLKQSFLPFVLPIKRKVSALTFKNLELNTVATSSVNPNSVSLIVSAVKQFVLPQIDEYELLVNKLLKNRTLPAYPISIGDIFTKIEIENFRVIHNTVLRDVLLNGSNIANSNKVLLVDLQSQNLNGNSKGFNEIYGNQKKFSQSNDSGPQQINLNALENALAIGRINATASDITEWMRRLSVELIRQSPSPIIRTCLGLAKAYRPLSEELFNIAFHSVWVELYASSPDAVDIDEDIPLINSIELALNSIHLPQNLMFTLLNLAGFMDMQDRRLPLNVKILARKANEANLYAKCLRYRELEYASKNLIPSKDCIEDLIAVNNELGLGDRAMGVLHNVMNDYPKINIEPLWLEKLNLWEEARQSYSELLQNCDISNISYLTTSSDIDGVKNIGSGLNLQNKNNATNLSRCALLEFNPDNPVSQQKQWFQTELGLMRCLAALGEYEEVESNAKELREQLRKIESLIDDTAPANSSTISMNSSGNQLTSNSAINNVNHMDRESIAAYMSEIQRLGAHSAWMLSKWEDIESFINYSSFSEPNVVDMESSSTSIRLDRNLGFYHTIVAIQKQEFPRAMSIIKEIRNKLTNVITLLLSESYPRAYRAMVTMQILAELEEIIEYKEAVANSVTSLAIQPVSLDLDMSRDQSYAKVNEDPRFLSSVNGQGINSVNNFNSSFNNALINSFAADSATSNHNKRFSMNYKRLSSSSVLDSIDNNVPIASADDQMQSQAITSALISSQDILKQKKETLIKKWTGRLKVAPKEISVFRQVLAVHTLVADLFQDLDSALELVSLCRKEGMFTLCENLLRKLRAPLPPRESFLDLSLPSQVLTSLPATTATNVTVEQSTGESNIDRNIGRVTNAADTQTVSIPSSISMDTFASSVLTSSHDSRDELVGSTNTSLHGVDNTSVNTPGDVIGRLSPAVLENDLTVNSIHNYLQNTENINIFGKYRIVYSTIKYWWASGKQDKALMELNNFLKHSPGFMTSAANTNLAPNLATSSSESLPMSLGLNMINSHNNQDMRILHVKCLLKKAEWMRLLGESVGSIQDVMTTLLKARELTPDHYSVWHAWAVVNYDQLQQTTETKNTNREEDINVESRSDLNQGHGIHVSYSTTSLDDDDKNSIAGENILRGISPPPVGNGSSKIVNSNVKLMNQQDRNDFVSRTGKKLVARSTNKLKPIANSAVTSGDQTSSTQISTSVPKSSPLKPKPIRKNSILIATSGNQSLSLVNLMNLKHEDKVIVFVGEAIKGFVRSIVLGQNDVQSLSSSSILQDTLRLLTLWFSYGSKEGISAIIDTELDKLSPEQWLSVLPQLIARLHVKSPEISNTLRKLLIKVAKIHPQALVCPIYVALNTNDEQQKQLAFEVLSAIRQKPSSGQLVEEATLVSRELMRVAITPHELWFDGIEKACTSYLEGNIPLMLSTLISLHEAMFNSREGDNHLIGDEAIRQSVSSVNSIGSEKEATPNISSFKPFSGATPLSPSADKSAKSSSNSIIAPTQDMISNIYDNIIGSNTNNKIGFSSLRDISFRNSYSQLLTNAYEWIIRFQHSGITTELHQAWDIYYIVFKKLESQIKTFQKFLLSHVSPELANAVDLKLAVPGTYQPSQLIDSSMENSGLSTSGVQSSPGFLADSSTQVIANNTSLMIDNSGNTNVSGRGTCGVISIAKFSLNIMVIQSKQRPRRICITGSNGKIYPFLLKGNEDLRQDERVMQLFGLINVCINNDNRTRNRVIDIVRYSVLPLSNNSGLIGWVQNCDTFNQLITDYRKSKGLRVGIELGLLQNKSLNFDMGVSKNPMKNSLTIMQKIEIFEDVLEETTGQDLAQMLWLKSRTADIWVERRRNFTKSMAVMSMAGYILGLGDRHPSNLMLHRVSGRVIHIDFGDCFEITKQRSKFPEVIPFRLTRMLQKSMEKSGIEGSYRVNCERVMRVLRDNKDSVMAMLEAFVYDPLISWRLLKGKANDDITPQTNTKETVNTNLNASSNNVQNSNAINTPESPKPKIGSLKMKGSIPEDVQQPELSNPVELLRGHMMQRTASIRLKVPELSEHDPIPESNPQQPVAGSVIDGGAIRYHAIRGVIEGNNEEETFVPLPENINARAIEVITRIQAKLSGKDFVTSDSECSNDELTIEQQVDRLILEATSSDNLCQLFAGWCPFW